MGYEQRSVIKQAEVHVEHLRKIVDPTVFEFQTTEEVPELNTIIGQERGSTVMRFGLQVQKAGYNIYVSGIPGTGKTTSTHSIIDEIAQEDVELFDWCYVYNFSNSYKPKSLQLPVGYGKKLQADMEKLVENMLIEIPEAFNEETYQTGRATIMREHKEASREVFERLNELAKSYGFVVRQSKSEYISIPLNEDGKPMSEEQYKALSEDKLAEIKAKSSDLEVEVLKFSKEFQSIEEQTEEKIEQLDEQVAFKAIGHRIEKMRDTYQDCQAVIDYLQEVEDDILKNVSDFLVDEEEQHPLHALMSNRKQTDFTIKYQVNVLVDHSETKGAPVITADNPTFYNMMGRVEYENRMGMMSTNFTKIMPGFLHEANGGYIIIQAKDILSKNYAWDGLKRALHTGKLTIENIGEHAGLMTTTSLDPDAVPLDVKVIIIGNRQLYQMLHFYDEDFSKLFKIKADFDVEMDYNVENMSRLASFIHTHCEENDLHHFERDAVAKLVEYSSRIAGHQDKLSTQFNRIVEIIYEADTWAEIDNVSYVTADLVEKAIRENEYRSNLIAEKMQEQIAEQHILIATEGSTEAALLTLKVKVN